MCNKCKVCHKELIKKTSNACNGICQQRYRRLVYDMSVIDINHKSSKDLNKGFSWDECNLLGY